MPSLLKYLSTEKDLQRHTLNEYKMSRHQRHLQYDIMYTMTNEGGG